MTDAEIDAKTQAYLERHMGILHKQYPELLKVSDEAKARLFQLGVMLGAELIMAEGRE